MLNLYIAEILTILGRCILGPSDLPFAALAYSEKSLQSVWKMFVADSESNRQSFSMAFWMLASAVKLVVYILWLRIAPFDRNETLRYNVHLSFCQFPRQCDSGIHAMLFHILQVVERCTLFQQQLT